MIPKPIDSSRTLQLDLVERATQTHASGAGDMVRRVTDEKKDREEDREEHRDRYEHQAPPRPYEELPDFSKTLRIMSLTDQPATVVPSAAQLPLPGLTFPLTAESPRVPEDGRGGRLDLEA